MIKKDNSFYLSLTHSDCADQSSLVILEQCRKCPSVLLPVVRARIDGVPPSRTYPERSLYSDFSDPSIFRSVNVMIDRYDDKKRNAPRSGFYILGPLSGFCVEESFHFLHSFELAKRIKRDDLILLSFSPIIFSSILSFSFSHFG